MRMVVEGLTALDAVDYVLQDNLHGLELDARCGNCRLRPGPGRLALPR